MMSVPFTGVLGAKKRIAAHIHRTPLELAARLTEHCGVPVWLKKEHQQLTGSFKLRGATNAVLALSAGQRANGVCTASTGNHGRALAYAAKSIGTHATICMSRLVPDNKVKAIEALGAGIKIVGRSQDDAQAEVDRLVVEESLVAIPPFDHENIIAGQGTLGLEILEDIPELDAILVPLSGGGLIAGVALAVKTLSPKTQVIGISMERGAAMIACLAAGKPVVVKELPTLADSLGGGIGLENRHTFAMVRDLVDETVTVTEREIADAITHAYEHEGEVLEGAAAVPIAALLAGKVAPKGPSALILSGKNLDMAMHRAIVSRTHPVYQKARSHA